MPKEIGGESVCVCILDIARVQSLEKKKTLCWPGCSFSHRPSLARYIARPGTFMEHEKSW